MTVEHETRGRRPLAALPTASPKLPMESPLLEDCLRRLKPEPARFAAAAPGRLNILAGLSDYTGALVLNMPMQEHCCVVVQRADSGVITVIIADSSNGDRPFEIAAEKLRSGAGIIRADDESCVDGACLAAKCIVATIAEALRAGVLPPVTSGLTIAVAANDIATKGASRAASICAATLVALSGALDCNIDIVNACGICQRVENDWLKAPVGLADALCALTSEPGNINQVRCDPCSSGGALPLPEGVEIVAVDSGYECKEAAQKFARVRSATFMGRSLIDRIIRHDGLNIRWEGYLSSVAVNDYTKHFRDRIPTRLKGKEYVTRFGDAIDPLTRVEPDEFYKIRSRTEHHIYEHDRSCKFIECLSRAARAKDDKPLREAGEVMFASHWSYGQRCGLGSVDTDRIVVLLRDAAKDGIYGAKIAGRGCGGMVAVLKKKDARADEALERIVAQYMEEKGRRARLLRGSIPGATLTGPRAV